MNQRIFSESSYQVPYNFYDYGAAFGYLQNSDQKQILPNRSDKSPFSIDSLLTHRCSREVDTTESTRRIGLQDECLFARRRDQRFHPYFSASPVSLDQSNAFVKQSNKNENERTEIVDQKSWSLEKPKRMRTIFTVEQLERMEREFDRQQYMVGADRFFLANELGLTETQVKVWFQNRRIKWRKNILEKQHRELSGRFSPSTNI